MSELQERGRRLLDKLHATSLQLALEKKRFENVFEERVELVDKERASVDQAVRRLRPAVAAGTATEAMTVDYALALQRRQQLDEERFDLRESVAQLNLPGEELILKRRENLNGESTLVDD